MSKTDNLAELSIRAKELGMTYGQYCTYLTTHRDTKERHKSPYRHIRQSVPTETRTEAGNVE